MEKFGASRTKRRCGICGLFEGLSRLALVGLVLVSGPSLVVAAEQPPSLGDLPMSAPGNAGFGATAGSSIEQHTGRPIEPEPAGLGRLLFFDLSGGLHDDNTCGGCHSPANGFGDSQSIAIGAQNNSRVGGNREGPRNQRRTPSAMDTAFYPKLIVMVPVAPRRALAAASTGG